MKERNKLHARRLNNNSQTLLVYFFSYLKWVCSTWGNYRVNSSKIRKPLVSCQRGTGNLVTHFSWLPVLLLRKAIGIVFIFWQWSFDFCKNVKIHSRVSQWRKNNLKSLIIFLMFSLLNFMREKCAKMRKTKTTLSPQVIVGPHKYSGMPVFGPQSCLNTHTHTRDCLLWLVWLLTKCKMLEPEYNVCCCCSQTAYSAVPKR